MRNYHVRAHQNLFSRALLPAAIFCNFIGLLLHTVNLFETVYPYTYMEKIANKIYKISTKLVSHFRKIFLICSYRTNLFENDNLWL